MTHKLVAGGLGPSTVETHNAVAAIWYTHVTRFRDIPHRQQELASLTEWVQDQANAAESAAMDSGKEPYGRFMHDKLISVSSTRGVARRHADEDSTRRC